MKTTIETAIGNRKGVAITDLLVAACCGLLLLALVLPGLNHLRESASQRECANRMRQLAIAMHNFHDAFKRLPPGTLGHARAVSPKDWATATDANWARTQHTSCKALVMPFMELNSEYDQMDPVFYNMYKFLDEHIDPRTNEPYNPRFWLVTGFERVALKKLPEFFCPTDNMDDYEGDVLVATQPLYDGEQDSMGTLVYETLESRLQVPEWDGAELGYKTLKAEESGIPFAKPMERVAIGATNFLACAGANSGGQLPTPALAAYAGMMSSRGKITLESVSNVDGNSNTIMLGESLGRMREGQRQLAQAWISAGLGRGRSENPMDMDPMDMEFRPLLGDPSWASELGFSSAHISGVNFSMGDASIVSVTRDVDTQVFYGMCGVNDGSDDSWRRRFVVRPDSGRGDSLYKQDR